MKPRALLGVMGLLIVMAAAAAAPPPKAVTPPAAWRSVGVGGGGALYAPAISPHNPDEMFINCDMSEAFHTTNFGRSWEAVHFSRLQVSAASPAMQFTSDPKVLYTLDMTAERGQPVRSRDGGKTWVALKNDPTGHRAWNIITDPTRTDRLLIAGRHKVYFTHDNAKTFREIVSHKSGVHLAGAFFDGSFIAIATSRGFFISVDNARQFERLTLPGIPKGEAMVSFAGGRKGEQRRFLCVTLTEAAVFPGVKPSDGRTFRGVYRLDWGVKRWVGCNTHLGTRPRPFHVAMARNNIDVAWLGGRSGSVPTILRSTDGGRRWESVFGAHGNRNIATGWCGTGGARDWSYSEVVFGLAVHPTDAKRVAFTDYGFIHVTTDGGASWRQAYVAPETQNAAGEYAVRAKGYRSCGLENTSCWDVAWLDEKTLWASFADIRGIRSTDGGASWNLNYKGHLHNTSHQVLQHPKRDITFMATSSVHDLYQSTHLTDRRIDKGKGGVLFSMNKGRTWAQLGWIGKPVVRMALDARHPLRLYATVAHSRDGGVYACKDFSHGPMPAWRRLPPPPRTEGHAFNIHSLRDGTLVCTYSGRRAGKGNKFTPSSGVFMTSRDSKSWLDRSHRNMRFWTKDLTVDPYDVTQDTWYVAVYSGWGGEPNKTGGLYMTRNRGKEWKRIFDNNRVGSCTVHPKNPKVMYVATEMDGLWFTDNLTDATPRFRRLDNYPFRHPERILHNPHKPGEVWVTSFGNGIRVGLEK